MCGTHKFMNSVQVYHVAKGNKHRVQNVKCVSIINSDVTEPSVYQSSSCIASKTLPMHPPYTRNSKDVIIAKTDVIFTKKM